MAVFIKPDGSTVELDAADFKAAAERGYRAETAEEQRLRLAGEHPVRAALEGAARTATFGISDAAQAGALEGAGQDPRQIKDRAEANPIASNLGEVAGFFTPGPKAATKLGEKAAAGIASKAGARTVRGAVEGGLFGLGSAISENTFGDPGTAGEHLAAGTLGGMLAGGVITPILGGVGDVGRSALIKAFGGRALKDTLGDMAEKSVMRQILTPADMAKKSTGKNLNEMGRFGIEEGFFKGMPTTTEVSARSRARADKAWSEIDGALKNLDQNYTVVGQPTQKGVINMQQFNGSQAAARMQPLVSELKNNPAAKEIRERLQKTIDLFNNVNESPKSFSDAWKTASWMWDSIGPTEAGGLKKVLKRMRGELQDEIFSQAGKLDPELGAALKKSNRDFYLANRISELSQKTADRSMQNRMFSPTDYLIGVGAGHLGGLTAGPAGLAAGVVGAGAHRFIRERGGFVLGSALDTMAKSKVFDRIGNGLQKSIQAGLASNPLFGGPFRNVLETAAAEGAQSLLETHLRLAKSDPSYLASVNMPDENPNTVAEYADKAHRLGSMFQGVDDGNAKIDKAISGFLEGKSSKIPERSPTRAEYDTVVEQLQKLINNENTLHKGLAELAPGTSATAALTMLNAAKFLGNKMPVDPNKGLPLALQRPWNPSTGDLRVFFRYVDAVANPAGIFEKMAQGRLTPESIETLQNVYPKLYQEFKDRMSSRLAEQQTPMTRQQRAALGGLIGGMDNAPVVNLIQTMHKASNPPPMPQQTDGRQKVDAVKNEQTQAQRLENRNQP